MRVPLFFGPVCLVARKLDAALQLSTGLARHRFATQEQGGESLVLRVVAGQSFQNVVLIATVL